MSARSADRIAVSWATREPPLAPIAAVAIGEGARALIQRLLDRSDEALAKLKGLSGAWTADVGDAASREQRAQGASPLDAGLRGAWIADIGDTASREQRAQGASPLDAGPGTKQARARELKASAVLVLGEPDALPWIDGAIYLGRDADAPSLLLPTTRKSTIAAPLLARALAKLHDGPIAVLEAPALLIPAAAALPLSRRALTAFLEMP